MRMHNRSLRNYKTTQILTSDAGRIVLMLYDAAISDLEQAADLTREKKYAERAKKIERATDIVFELLASLDHDRGGEIATNLSQIYCFLALEIVRAIQKNDPDAILRCRDVLMPLREGWSQILKDGTPREKSAFRIEYSTHYTATV